MFGLKTINRSSNVCRLYQFNYYWSQEGATDVGLSDDDVLYYTR